MNIKLSVTGTHCKSCGMLIEEALQELGATSIVVKVDEKKQVATVACEFSGKKEAISKAVKNLGYKVTA